MFPLRSNRTRPKITIFQIGLYAAVKGVDLLVTIGSEAEHCAQAASDAGIAAAVCFKDNEEAFQFLAGELVFGDVVLFKGSRSESLRLTQSFLPA